MNGKLKVFADYRPKLWRAILTFIPILGAIIISLDEAVDSTRIWDNAWCDCLIGAAIGTVAGFSSYRMAYASIFDYRVNHMSVSASFC